MDLYLDFDSTIVDSEDAFCEVYNEFYKDYEGFVPAKGELVEDWIFEKQCPLLHVDEGDTYHKVMEIFESELFFEKLNFYSGALDTINQLAEKYDIVICTSASHKNASRKVLWIEEHLDMIKEIIVIIDKNEKGVGKRRVPMMEENAIFIDDHPKNLYSTKASRKVLYKSKETEYNMDWEGETVSSWSMISEKLL